MKVLNTQFRRKAERSVWMTRAPTDTSLYIRICDRPTQDNKLATELGRYVFEEHTYAVASLSDAQDQAEKVSLNAR